MYTINPLTGQMNNPIDAIAPTVDLSDSRYMTDGSPNPNYNPSPNVVQPTYSSTPVSSGPTAEEIQMARAREAVQKSQSAIKTGGAQTVSDVGNTFSTNTRKFVNTIGDTQADIDRNRSNTALNLRRSMASIINGVRQGLRSGGVTLANMNALDSGAADAMARAYSRAGGQQTGEARNVAALQNQEFDVNQKRLNREREEGWREFDVYRDTEVDRIRRDVRSKLVSLQASAVEQGLPEGTVDMGIVSELVDDAIARLAEVDKVRSAALAKIRALTPDEVNARAYEMDIAGAEGLNPFAVNGPGTIAPTAPTEGAPLSQLPIFVKRKES